MKSKGFTLTEIISVIVILGVLITIGTPIYITVSENARKSEYKSKIDYLRTQTLKYAEEQGIEGSQTISVATLISNGYIVADKYEKKGDSEIPFITNPIKSDSNLACKLVNIDIDGYEYVVKVLEDQENCELLNEDITISEMKIKAYKYTNGSAKDEISIKDGVTNWVNTDVALVFNPSFSNTKSIRVTHNGETKEVGSNKCSFSNVKASCDNVVIVSASSIIKDEVVITVETATAEKKAKIEVRIDKEPPTVSTASYDGWTKKKKSLTAYISDGSGSGAESVYLTETNNRSAISEKRRYKVDKGGYTSNGTVVIETALDSGVYYLWAKDVAGNVATKAEAVTISTVDNTPPSCIESGINDNWTNKAVTITWGCQDSESGCDPDYSGGQITFNGQKTQKEYTIKPYTIKDNAGNTQKCEGKKVNVYYDGEPPECVVNGEKTTWTKDPVTLTYGCQDSGSTCITKPATKTYKEYTVIREVYVVGGGICDQLGCFDTIENVYEETVTEKVIKKSTLPAYEVEDKAGNKKTCYENGKSVNIYYDHKEPNVSVRESSKTLDSISYETINNIKYSDPDSGIKEAKCTPKNTAEYGSRGRQRIRCEVTDNVGNRANVSYEIIHQYIGSPTSVTDEKYCGQRACGTKHHCGSKLCSCCADSSDASSCISGGDCSNDYQCHYTSNHCECECCGCGNDWDETLYCTNTCIVYECTQGGKHSDGSRISTDPICYYY